MIVGVDLRALASIVNRCPRTATRSFTVTRCVRAAVTARRNTVPIFSLTTSVAASSVVTVTVTS